MKKIKLKHSGASLLLSLVVISAFLIPSIQVNKINIVNKHYLVKNSDLGVSNYTITQSVIYRVEVNFSITQTGVGTGQYYMKHPRFDDLEPTSPTSPYSGPFQESELIYSKITGSEFPSYTFRDEYNNTFDVFNHSALARHDTIQFTQIYNITLNEVSYGDLSNLPITMSDYDQSDPIFKYFCNESDPIYPRDNPTLIARSNAVAGSFTNPYDKAKAIIEYVSSHITYNDELGTEEKGALWAEVQGTGDCSEYSTLMITLLRIQGIPARKAGGFMIVPNMQYIPNIGQSWTYNFGNLLGHAWVEYYIPSIGWIQCEPQNPSYIKKSSYLRLTQTLGAWFSFPYYNYSLGSVQEYNISEYNMLFTAYTNDLSYDYEIKITVIDTNFILGPDWISIIIWVSIIGTVVVVSITIIRAIVVKKRRNKNAW